MQNMRAEKLCRIQYLELQTQSYNASDGKALFLRVLNMLVVAACCKKGNPVFKKVIPDFKKAMTNIEQP